MLTVSRTRRVISILINTLTFNFLIIGNLILLFTKRTNLGGIVTGWRFNNGGTKIVIYYFTLILSGIGYALTLMILWIVDIVTLGKRDGTFAEKMAGIKKVNA